MRDSDTTFHRAFRKSSSRRLIDGDATRQIGGCNSRNQPGQARLFERQFNVAEIPSTYLGAEAREHNDADCAIFHQPET